MAHSNVWSNIIPAGGDAANTADDAIRQLRVDIHERMNEVVTDWTADPVVPIVPALATVCLTHSVAQTIANTTNVTLAWDTETFDVGGFHAAGATNSRITIPAGYAGYYLFGCHIFWSSDVAGYRSASLYKNGVVVHSSLAAPDDTGIAVHTVTFPPLAAVATDYFQLVVYQNSGGSETVTGVSAGDPSAFWAVRLGI